MDDDGSGCECWMKCSWNATVIAGCVWYWTQYEHSQGPTLVGTFLNLILYGVFMTQVYLYFNMYKQYVLL